MLLFLSIFLSVSLAEEFSYFATWETVPSIEICSDSNIEVDDIKRALKSWEINHGVDFDYGQIKKVKKCDDKKLNVIQIHDFKNYTGKHDHDDIAMTVSAKYYYDSEPGVSYIDRSTIYLDNNESRNLIIEHEIGHSFGIAHSNHGIMKAYPLRND